MAVKKKSKKDHKKGEAKNIREQTQGFFLWVCIGIITLVTFVSFYPSLQNDFVNWDDQEYITDNPMVVNTTVPLKEILSKPVSGNYHPLTMLTLAWNYQAGKLNAQGYHAINIIFHLFNTILVFIFILLLTRKNLLMASIVALFFGIHPMHVESVTWVSERKDVLYVFFFLAGLITYLNYRKSKKTVWYFVTLLLFIFSCLSKGMAVVFPIILLLLDYYLLPQGTRLKTQDYLLKIPYFIFSLFFGVITYHFQQQGLPPDIVIYNPFYKIIFACYGTVMYIVKFFVPISLSAFYPYPSKGNTFSYMIYFPFIFIGLILLIYFFLRKERAIVFGLLFYFVSIMLVLQLVTVGSAIIADRYTYLSYIGLLFAVAHIINKSWKEKSTMLASMKYPLAGAMLIAAIVFSFQTYASTEVWKNGETLWTNEINNYPELFSSYANRGEYYQALSEDDSAFSDFTKSLELKPSYSEAYNNRGLIYYKRGKYDLALADYSNAIKYSRDTSQFSSFYANRALTLMRLGKNDKAQKDMEQAFIYLKQTSKYKVPALLVNRAFYYQETGQYDKAVSDYTSYLLLKPEDDIIFNTRGLCYVKLNKINDAYYDFNKAVELKPTVPNYWLNRSTSENTLGRKVEAKTDALKAQELGMYVDPNYLKATGL